MHISVPNLVKYTDKANIFALKSQYTRAIQLIAGFPLLCKSLYHLNISNVTIMCITYRACNNISKYLMESEVGFCLLTKNWYLS